MHCTYQGSVQANDGNLALDRGTVLQFCTDLTASPQMCILLMHLFYRNVCKEYIEHRFQ